MRLERASSTLEVLDKEKREEKRIIENIGTKGRRIIQYSKTIVYKKMRKKKIKRVSE